MTTTVTGNNTALCDEVRTMLTQRHDTYGDPKDVFKKTAELWSCHLSIPLVAKDVVVMLIAFKLSSLHQNSSPERTHDVLCDVVGYATLLDYVEGFSTLPVVDNPVNVPVFDDVSSVGEDFLEHVATLVDGERQDDYGDEKESHAAIARQWSALTGAPVRPIDVDILMMYYKLVRIVGPVFRRDSVVDLCGYALLADRNRGDKANRPLADKQ